MSKFDEWGEWYDFINQQSINESPELEFYQRLFNEYGGPSLELACGTGRLLIQSLEEGYEVHGVDISQEMIEITQQKLEEKNLETQLYQQDVEELNITKEYPVVYYPFNSLTHFTTIESQRRVFRNCYNVVKENGVFAFDVYVPDFEKINNYGTLSRTKRMYNGTTYTIEVWNELESQAEQTFNHYNRVINDEKGTIEWETKFTLSLLPKQQLELLLNDAGFSEYTFYDGFTTTPLQADSDHMSVVAVK